MNSNGILLWWDQKMRKGTIQVDGRKVQDLREKKGWNQATLAAEAGLHSAKTITHVEGGKPVLVETLGSIATALGVDPQELLPGTKAAQSPTTTQHATASGLLPAVPALLIGRDQALKDIKHRLGISAGKRESRGSPIRVTVHGWPGVGKSTLVAALAHEPEILTTFPDGVLWTSLGPLPSIDSELRSWVRVLSPPEMLPAETPGELSRYLAGLLRQRRMLLIVDDVWDVSQAMPFLVGGRACAMLVTTRLPGVAEALSPTPDDVYRLDVLPEKESLELLEKLAPRVVGKHREECRELVRALEGLPLALQVAGRLLRAEEKHGWSVADLLTELRHDASKLLNAQAPADMAELHQVSPTVTALLRKSTDKLDPVVRKQFACLAPFAPRPASFELADMMAVWKVSDDEARRTVNVLVDRGLLEPSGAGDYRIHQVLVQHAKSLLPKRYRG